MEDPSRSAASGAGDNAEVEVDEGLPSHEDPFIKQYFAGREALIEQEKSQRSDESFRQSLSPMAIEASSIVSRILTEEHATFWSTSRDHVLINQKEITMYPGMMFQLAKSTIESTKSWQIVKKMPKGALLHAHVDATGDVDFIIDLGFHTEGMAIASSEPLNSEAARVNADVYFCYQKASSLSGASIWTEGYQVDHLVPLQEAADAFPEEGRGGFIKWIRSKCTISPTESLTQYRGVDAIWQKFVKCFRPIDSIQNYEPIHRCVIRRLLEDISNDGIKWVDFRCPFVSEYRLEGSEIPSPDHADFLQVWREELANFRASHEESGFWGCRFIWTSLRSWDSKRIVEHMKACIQMKKLFPDLVCGYDLVGQEDLGRPIAEALPELFWFKKQCFEAGVEIPFFFHAGECLGDGDETDSNLFDAILLGTRRIGHGFSLFKHPLLINMVKNKRILIESCPISNEVLRLTGSIKSHPLPALLSRGVACCLCNDDPGILGYGSSGVSHDFWQALQGWENLGLEGLGSLAENSVRWACYEDQTGKAWTEDIGRGKYGSGARASRLKEWFRDWEKFCEWIVREYAIEYGGDL